MEYQRAFTRPGFAITVCALNKDVLKAEAVLAPSAPPSRENQVLTRAGRRAIDADLSSPGNRARSKA